MKKMNNKGFTIVELMIATAIFSVVMLVCAAAIIYVGRMYYKGVIMNRTQDAARRSIDEVTHSVQFGSGTLTPEEFLVEGTPIEFTDAGTGQVVEARSWCLGQARYSYATDKSMGGNSDQTKHVLWKDILPNGAVHCPPADLTKDNPSDPETNGQELLGETMRIPVFDINYVGGVWAVDMTVSYGIDAGLFEDGSNFTLCKGVEVGGQFCSVSKVDTGVFKRL